MIMVDENCYNSLILGVMCKDLPNRVNQLDKNYYQEELVFSFDSFIKSQISFKVLDISYLTLLQACIMYKSIENRNELGLDMSVSLKYLAKEFLEKFSIVGMYLSLYRNLKIDFKFTNSVFSKLFNIESDSDYVYLIKDFREVIMSGDVEDASVVKVQAYINMELPNIDTDVNIEYLNTLYNLNMKAGDILDED